MYHPLLIMICSMILYPQIITNLKLQLHNFDKNYILFFVFPRLILLLYFRISNKNIENLRPYPFLCCLSLLIFLLSVIVIYLQTQYGSYFFIPRCLRWKQFNYFIKTKQLRKILLGNDLSFSGSEKDSAFSSSLKKWVSGIFKKQNDSDKIRGENTQELQCNDSIISKDPSLLKKNENFSEDSELDFIKIEDQSAIENKAEKNTGKF